MNIMEFILLFMGALGIGFASAIGGIGGGSLMVPYMVLILKYNVRTAIASSLMTIIATSCSASSIYFEKKLVNIDIALILIPTTVLGAIIGSYTNLSLPQSIVKKMLGLVLIIIAFMILIKPLLFREATIKGTANYKYFDESLGKYIVYGARNRTLAAILAIISGVMSGMFGIGGGVIMVPIMALIMGIPIKVAVATSSFIIGLNAATGSITYLAKGITHLEVVTALILGIIPGAILGAKTMSKLKPRAVQIAFSIIIAYSGIKLIM